MKTKIISLMSLVIIITIISLLSSKKESENTYILYDDSSIKVNTIDSTKKIPNLYNNENLATTSYEYIKLVGKDGTITYKKIPKIEPERKIYNIYGNFTKNKRSYQRFMEDEIREEHICNSFVVNGGDKTFIDKYKSWINEGNSVNYLDGNGNIVINLDFTNLSENLQNKILSSNQTEITLEVIEKQLRETEAMPCQSFIDILNVK